MTVLQSTRESLEARLAAVGQAVSSWRPLMTWRHCARRWSRLRPGKRPVLNLDQSPASHGTALRSRLLAEPLPFRVIGAELRAGQRNILRPFGVIHLRACPPTSFNLCCLANRSALGVSKPSKTRRRCSAQVSRHAAWRIERRPLHGNN